MQPMIHFSWEILFAVLGAVVVFAIVDQINGERDNIVPTIPALIAGYLVYRFARYSMPFWIWFASDGFLQLSVALVIGACAVTAVWLLRNRIPSVPRAASDEGSDEGYVPAHALPKVVYHGTPSHSNAKDIADKHRFLANDGRFYVATDLDYAKVKAGSNGTVLKCEVKPWAKLKKFGGHYYYEHHGSCDYQGYYPLRGLKPTHFLQCNKNY